MQCVGDYHGTESIEATHQAAVMLWSLDDLPIELRAPTAGRVFNLAGQTYCTACRLEAATAPPAMDAMLEATGNDPTLDYEHPQWCFVGLDDAGEQTNAS
jgi:hypothetical protein